MDKIEPLLTIKDLCNYLSTKESHVRWLIFNNKIPYIRVGKLIRFDFNEIKQWLKNNNGHKGE
jgi:excisionase family DNA binding protein